jgi:hypothetical protein
VESPKAIRSLLKKDKPSKKEKKHLAKDATNLINTSAHCQFSSPPIFYDSVLPNDKTLNNPDGCSHDSHVWRACNRW